MGVGTRVDVCGCDYVGKKGSVWVGQPTKVCACVCVCVWHVGVSVEVCVTVWVCVWVIAWAEKRVSVAAVTYVCL